jgi:hypothetical protein
VILQVSGGIHFRVLPLPACYVQFHSATVSTYEEEGLPAWKRAKRCCPRCSLGRTRSQRCRRACFRTPRAVSAAIGRFDRTTHHTGAAEPATAAAPAAPDGADPLEPRTGQKRKASSAPDVCLELRTCPCTLLRFARMRRCARPRHRLRCGAACRRCRGFGCTDRVPPRRPRRARWSGRCLPVTAPARRMHTRTLDYGCSPAMPHWLRMPAIL